MFANYPPALGRAAAYNDQYAPAHHHRAHPRDDDDVHIETDEDDARYTITASAPDGAHLQSPQATIERGKHLHLEGIVYPDDDADELELALRRRAGLFDAPSRSRCVGTLRAGTTLRGRGVGNGWIELSEGLGYVIDDGSLQLLRRTPAERPRRFSRAFDMPADALLDQATTRSRDGTFSVVVPRRRPPAPPARPTTATARAARAVDAHRQPSQRPAATRATAPPPPPPPPAKVQRSSAVPTPPAAQPTAQTPATAQPPSRPARPARTPAASSAARVEAGGALPRMGEPLLTFCREWSAANVQRPREESEDWRATACGGFARGDTAAAVECH